VEIEIEIITLANHHLTSLYDPVKLTFTKTSSACFLDLNEKEFHSFSNCYLVLKLASVEKGN
jgi:hypothetical protein